MCVCVCVCVCVWGCARARERACVRSCMRACVRVCVCGSLNAKLQQVEKELAASQAEVCPHPAPPRPAVRAALA